MCRFGSKIDEPNLVSSRKQSSRSAVVEVAASLGSISVDPSRRMRTRRMRAVPVRNRTSPSASDRRQPKRTRWNAARRLPVTYLRTPETEVRGLRRHRQSIKCQSMVTRRSPMIGSVYHPPRLSTSIRSRPGLHRDLPWHRGQADCTVRQCGVLDRRRQFQVGVKSSPAAVATTAESALLRSRWSAVRIRIERPDIRRRRLECLTVRSCRRPVTNRPTTITTISMSDWSAEDSVDTHRCTVTTATAVATATAVTMATTVAEWTTGSGRTPECTDRRSATSLPEAAAVTCRQSVRPACISAAATRRSTPAVRITSSRRRTSSVESPVWPLPTASSRTGKTGTSFRLCSVEITRSIP